MLNSMSKVRVKITATMEVEFTPYNDYSSYIGLPGFPDIPQEEVECENIEELAKRMVKVDDEHGEQSLGAAYNEDWQIKSIEATLIEA